MFKPMICGALLCAIALPAAAQPAYSPGQRPAFNQGDRAASGDQRMGMMRQREAEMDARHQERMRREEEHYRERRAHFQQRMAEVRANQGHRGRWEHGAERPRPPMMGERR